MKELRRIITFSRRSDPAFFIPWLMKRLEDGFCDVPNPFSGKPYRVPLDPESVALFTFWTKNPGPVVRAVEQMNAEGFRTACFITVTGYPPVIEPNVPSSEKISDAVSRLSDILSPDALWWRYDPVIFTTRFDAGWHRDNFEKLCRTVWKGHTRRVIFSLAHIDGSYRPLRRALEKTLFPLPDNLEMPPFSSDRYDELYERTMNLFSSLSDIARSFGIDDVEVCCSPKLRPGENRIEQGHCLSLDYIRKLVPDIGSVPHVPTRSGSSMSSHGYAECGCVKSTDIGIHGTCSHGCVYCYANRRGMNTDAIDRLLRS